jgi:hypothetical protein
VGGPPSGAPVFFAPLGSSLLSRLIFGRFHAFLLLSVCSVFPGRALWVAVWFMACVVLVMQFLWALRTRSAFPLTSAVGHGELLTDFTLQNLRMYNSALRGGRFPLRPQTHRECGRLWLQKNQHYSQDYEFLTVRLLRWIQRIDATHALNLSAGVS